MLRKVAFLVFVVTLFLTGFLYAQNSSWEEQMVYKGDTITISAIPLTEISSGVEAANKTLSNFREELIPDDQLASIDSMSKIGIHRAESEKQKISKSRGTLTFHTIITSNDDWDRFKIKVNENLNYVTARLSSFDADIHQLAVLDKTWKQTLKEADAQTAPAGIKETIRGAINEIGKVRLTFKNREDSILIIQNEVAKLLVLITDIQNELEHELQAIQSNYLIRDEPPIWRTTDSKEGLADIGKYFNNVLNQNIDSVVNYIGPFNLLKYGSKFVKIFLLFLLFFFLKKESGKLQIPEDDKRAKLARAIVSQPILSSIITILAFTILFNLKIPVAAGKLLIFILIIISAVTSSKLFRGQFKFVLVSLAGVLIVNSLMLLFDPKYLYARLILIVLAVFTMWILDKIGRKLSVLHDSIKPKWQKIIRATIWLLIIVLAIGVISNLFGYLNLSLALVSTSINASINAILVIIIVIVTNSAIIILLRTDFAAKSNIIKKYEAVTEKYLIKTVGFVWVFVWGGSILKSLGVYSSVLQWFNQLLDIYWGVGTTTISFGGIIGFFTVIIITYLVYIIIKILLNIELFPRINIPRGIKSMIFMILSYSIVAVGIYLALAAAHVELSKFTLLAGALGVGIGFGLQSIVNNFISGIILFIERPIAVGDTIEVGGNRGHLESIGVRASTIRLYDGSEVIIPNGNLISNNVVNWTLSDKKQRDDIIVSVAYGSDLHQVLDLLAKVGGENPQVLKTPAPEAFFIGFGDSSLNFTLKIWSHIDSHFRVKSQVAVAVYDALNEVGIKIPFPQQDVNLKSVDHQIVKIYKNNNNEK